MEFIFGLLPIILSIVMICLSVKYRKKGDLKSAGFAFLLFVISLIYMESQVAFITENLLSFILSAIFYVLPVFLILYSISIVSKKRIAPLMWSLALSFVAFCIGLGYQTEELGGGFMGDIYVMFFVLALFIFYIVAFIFVIYKIHKI